MTERPKLERGNESRAEAEVADRMDESRRRIDQLDEKIIQLLNARAEAALDLGRLKESAGLETYQPDREIAVLEHARRVNPGPLDAGAITRLFERIIDENRRLERLAKKSYKGRTSGGDAITTD